MAYHTRAPHNRSDLNNMSVFKGLRNIHAGLQGLSGA